MRSGRPPKGGPQVVNVEGRTRSRNPSANAEANALKAMRATAAAQGEVQPAAPLSKGAQVFTLYGEPVTQVVDEVQPAGDSIALQFYRKRS